MKRIQLVFVALACAAFMFGCKKSDDAAATPAPTTTTTTGGATADKTPDAAPKADDTATNIVGEWTVTKSEKGGPENMTVEFKPDSSITGHADGKMDDKHQMSMDMEGTYKVDGDKVSMHIAKIDNVTVTGPDADAINAKLKSQMPPPPPDETATLAWNGKDEFVATNSKGSKDTYKRKTG